MADLFPVAILAGGLATRLRPITQSLPKALVDVDGEPFIHHQLRLLQRKGISRVIVCAGYLGEMIQDDVGNGSRFGLGVSFSFDGGQLLGTAGAIRQALPLLDGHFFVLYGDSYLPCDYGTVQQSFDRSGKSALMTVYRNEGHWDTSNVEMADGRIVAYDKHHRTPAMRFIDYGLGVFSTSAFDSIATGQRYDLATLYQDLLKQNDLAAFEVDQRFYEIGSFAGLAETRAYLAKEKAGEAQK